MNSPDLLEAIIESQTGHAIVYIDATGIIRLWNSGAEKVFRYTSHEAIGKRGDLLFPADDARAHALQQEMAAVEGSGRVDTAQWLARRGGELFWAEGVTYTLRSASGAFRGCVKVIRDATTRKQSEEEVARLALTDALTGLPNRAVFEQRLREAASLSVRHDRPFFVLLLDLDHFKHINDLLGHPAGDELLRQVAQRMRSAVRESDVVSRLGGDEFGVLITEADDQQTGGVIAEKILASLADPIQVGDQRIAASASIGISVCPNDGADAMKLAQKADMALYKAKAEGRNNYQYFTDLLNHRAHHRTHELAQMKRVLPRHFGLLYQPVVDGCSQVIAVEALLRCTHPYFSGYPIEVVVALASETGQLREIGVRSVTAACEQAARWQRDGWPNLHLVMNFYRTEIGAADLVERIAAAVEQADFPLGSFEADLSERQLRGGDHDDRVLYDIRRFGVALTIDDFSGHASLVRLASMIRKLKIDLKYFPGLPDDSRSRSVLTAITDLAHALGLPVIIERVQTQGEAEFVRDRCDGMQGFYYAQPMTARDTTQWLAEKRPGRAA